jgi:hypothetical protein
MHFLVIVNGYTEGKFDDHRGHFSTTLDVAPVAGDFLEIAPGPTWGRIACVVERRLLREGEDDGGVTILARLATDKDHNVLGAYGQCFGNEKERDHDRLNRVDWDDSRANGERERDREDGGVGEGSTPDDVTG